jgi:nucleotide-binding universal stress UspA family protein
MYANVIVGVDGRQGGQDAAALAALLASPTARRHLVHVAGPSAHNGRGSTGDVHLELADPDCLRWLMGRERKMLGGDAPTVRVPADSVADGLAQAAAERDADLIVVGAARGHGFARLASRDDVAPLLHHTHETVAVAPLAFSEAPRRLERIGVAFDRSPESFVALAHAGLLAEERGCEVVVRHVAPAALGRPAPGRSSVTAPARGRPLSAAADGVLVETVGGSPHGLLLALARDVDLLVCGSRRAGLLRRLALGSMTDYLTRHVAVPLLVPTPVDAAAVARWREHQGRREEVA